MKINRFDPPGYLTDLGSADLLQQWSDQVSANFDTAVASIERFMQAHNQGTPQFYNPLTHGLSDPPRRSTTLEAGSSRNAPAPYSSEGRAGGWPRQAAVALGFREPSFWRPTCAACTSW